MKSVLPIVLSIAIPWTALAGDFERGVKAHNRGDSETALRKWEPLAERGDAEAQFGLGVLYYQGSGVEQDRTLAAKWFLEAAGQGHVDAGYKVAEMYESGDGDPHDEWESGFLPPWGKKLAFARFPLSRLADGAQG